MTDRTMSMSGDSPDDYVRLSDHPRAPSAIKRAKSIGGLAGFVLGFLVAQRGGLPAFDTGVRALVGGITGYVLIWIAAIQLWRQIAIGEFRAAEKRRAAQREMNRRRRQEIAEHRNQEMAERRAERAGR